MSEQIVKNKIIVLGLAALLLVSCGGSGGGGGGNSNVPVNPGNSSTTPGNKIEDLINPKKPKNPGNTNMGTPTNPNNSAQNETRESLEKLRARMEEVKVREYILKELKNSTESIPTDDRKIDGATQKVAVLDGDFLKRKQYFENIYPGIEILDKTSNFISNSTHGEVVLKALGEKNKLGIIASSIGKETIVDNKKIDTVVPTLKDYQDVLNKFSPNQKIKIFSQS